MRNLRFIHCDPSISLTLPVRELAELSCHSTGFHIVTTHVVKKWEFPKDPFITYEKSDEDWCRYFGIGREVERPVRLTFPNAQVRSMHDGLITLEAFACREALATGEGE